MVNWVEREQKGAQKVFVLIAGGSSSSEEVVSSLSASGESGQRSGLSRHIAGRAESASSALKTHGKNATIT